MGVLPRATIQHASARAVAGKTRALAMSSRTAFAFGPICALPVRNQIKAWVSTTHFISTEDDHQDHHETRQRSLGCYLTFCLWLQYQRDRHGVSLLAAARSTLRSRRSPVQPL
jgi:hypothetical protein